MVKCSQLDDYRLIDCLFVSFFLIDTFNVKCHAWRFGCLWVDLVFVPDPGRIRLCTCTFIQGERSSRLSKECSLEQASQNICPFLTYNIQLPTTENSPCTNDLVQPDVSLRERENAGKKNIPLHLSQFGGRSFGSLTCFVYILIVHDLPHNCQWFFDLALCILFIDFFYYYI